MNNSLKRAAFKAFLILLRPIVRMLLRCGVTWREAAQLLKLAYVEAAGDIYSKYGRPANATRVAIVTGLSRRDVKRARDLLADGSEDRALASLEQIDHASRVLSGWFQDPDFVDRNGRPRLLHVDGDGSFAALLKRYAPDIPVTAMLKELKSAGAVKETPSGRIRAHMRYYQPAALEAESVVRSGGVLHDLGATVAHNLFHDDQPTRFEGRSTNVNVARGARRAFREYLEARGMQFLEDVDRWLSKHEARRPDEKPSRLGVGLYWIQDE